MPSKVYNKVWPNLVGDLSNWSHNSLPSKEAKELESQMIMGMNKTTLVTQAWQAIQEGDIGDLL